MSGRPRSLHPLGLARQRLEPTAVLPAGAARVLAEADLGDEAAFLAWQVAEWGAGAPSLAEGERAEMGAALAGAAAASLAAVAQGSTRVSVGAGLAALLGRLPELVGGPGARTPFILDRPAAGRGDVHFLYQQRHHAAEVRIAAAVGARRRAPAELAEPLVERAVREVVETAAPAPSPEQAAAVSAAARAVGGGLAVITGGPGTGKTTIVLSLVRALVRLGLDPRDIALAAPTGKAANRLDEAIKAGLGALAAPGETDRALLARPPAARTMHRLLGYSPVARTFAHQAGSPLPERVVIVDEGSMIDLELMDRLLSALDPAAALVLLGDADQLPSVEAGAVFRDLAPGAVRLTRSHRLDPGQARGRQVLEVAAAVRAGALPPLPGALLALRESAAAVDFGGVELLVEGEREAFLERWYRERVTATKAATTGAGLLEQVQTPFTLEEAGFPGAEEVRLDALFAHHQSHRLLAVTRARPTGAEALNRWLHERLLDDLSQPATGAPPREGPALAYQPGEPVMVLRNDYDRGLWNGDQGLVIRVREGRRPPRTAAAFKVRGRWTAFSLASLGEGLTLAFALTVHKAQGSEYDDVALVLPDGPLPLLGRELIYTALTRSRRSVVVCGAPGVLAAGVAQSAVRSSGIAERLEHRTVL